MITDILKVLRDGDFYGVSKEVDFAKGSNEYTTTYKGLKNKVVRVWLKK